MTIPLPFILEKFFFITTGILGLSILVAIHELGHFFFCRIFNVYTPSFSIGFGPTLLAKKINSTLFKISLIPLGGYVEIATHEDSLPNSHTIYFSSLSWYKKLLIMLGGILFNICLAYCFIISLFLTNNTIITSYFFSTYKIESIEKFSVAEKEHFDNQYIIKTIDNNQVNLESPFSLLELLEQYLSPEDKNHTITFYHPSLNITKIITIEIPLETNIKPYATSKSAIKKLNEYGINFTPKKTNIFSAAYKGIQQTNHYIAAIGLSIKKVFDRSCQSELSGPIMIIALSNKVMREGFANFILFLAIISINLAIINLIPLPILDGGQILFLAIETIIQRPLPEKLREYISITCWLMFLILFAYLSWNDIIKLVSHK